MLTPTSLQCFNDGESSDHDGRLLSLLDMPRFYAMAFTTAYLQLEMLQGDSILLADDESAWRQKAEGCLRQMEKECREAGFGRLSDRCARLVLSVQATPILITCHLLRDLLPDIQLEMTRHLYFLVPENRKGLYYQDDRPLFGEAVANAIPNSTVEIAEAGRCFALERWTACVFHLMRAVELALHK